MCINSDQYLCQTKSDEVLLTVFEKLPVANAVDSIVICDNDSVGDDKDGKIDGFDAGREQSNVPRKAP